VITHLNHKSTNSVGNNSGSRQCWHGKSVTWRERSRSFYGFSGHTRQPQKILRLETWRVPLPAHTKLDVRWMSLRQSPAVSPLTSGNSWTTAVRCSTGDQASLLPTSVKRLPNNFRRSFLTMKVNRNKAIDAPGKRPSRLWAAAVNRLDWCDAAWDAARNRQSSILRLASWGISALGVAPSAGRRRSSRAPGTDAPIEPNQAGRLVRQLASQVRGALEYLLFLIFIVELRRTIVFGKPSAALILAYRYRHDKPIHLIRSATRY